MTNLLKGLNLKINLFNFAKSKLHSMKIKNVLFISISSIHLCYSQNVGINVKDQIPDTKNK